MSFEKYIELLQMLITMTDPTNRDQMVNAQEILKNLLELAESSRKVYPDTFVAMREGYYGFLNLMRHKDEFAGEPGDYAGNREKRKRLAMIIRPRC